MSAPVVGTMPMGRFHGQRDQTWRTPPEVYAALDAEFHFTLDPCPAHWDASYLNGLTRSWAGERVFCNPPYRRGQIEKWLAKAREAECAVYLLPARTGAGWWHDYALSADAIRFIRGRLRFGGATINAPEWSVILVFRASPVGEPETVGVGRKARKVSRNIPVTIKRRPILLSGRALENALDELFWQLARLG